MAQERADENAPDDWTLVMVRDPEPLNMRRLAEMDVCSGWLRDENRPGAFLCKWGITPHGSDHPSTASWYYWISDPQVAFEFKLRFG